MNVLLLYCFTLQVLQRYCSGIYEGSLCHYILYLWNHVRTIFECVFPGVGNLKNE